MFEVGSLAKEIGWQAETVAQVDNHTFAGLQKVSQCIRANLEQIANKKRQ